MIDGAVASDSSGPGPPKDTPKAPARIVLSCATDRYRCAGSQPRTRVGLLCRHEALQLLEEILHHDDLARAGRVRVPGCPSSGWLLIRHAWAILLGVSPTVLRVRGFRFFFFSREEPRGHVHVQHADGEAKFWIEPTVELHANYGLKPAQLAEALTLVEEHVHDIRNAWAQHFPR